MQKAFSTDDMADIKSTITKFIKSLLPDDKNEVSEIEASHGSGTFTHIFTVPFDGEKNLGEMGPIKDYFLEYELLRLRSWQSYLESEITQTVLGKFSKWVIGTGLKLQSEPSKDILSEEGIELDFNKFSKSVESRFVLYSKSKRADFSNMESLNAIAETVFLNAKIGGDVLVILRLVKGIVKVQVIDGEHVRSKRFGSEFLTEKLENGNTIVNGIELGKNGEHKAYHVMLRDFTFKRVAAKDRRGITRAFLVYGRRHRLDNFRGIPLISTVLETLKKMERYKEATVGSAEERQKIAYFFEHGSNSTGENPMAPQLAKAMDIHAGNPDIPTSEEGRVLADRVAATTNKEVFNLPPDSTIKVAESRNELTFEPFYKINFNIICAAIGIPPDVASSKYDSNFSASRAALKDWEHTLMVERNKFKEGFYDKIYQFWLEVNILQQNISAPGYLTAARDSDIIEAYRNCRFIGPGVPHIDPLKEVLAERAKLGASGVAIPLTTAEQSTEQVSSGEYDKNVLKYAEELKQSKELEIVAPVAPVSTTPSTEE